MNEDHVLIPLIWKINPAIRSSWPCPMRGIIYHTCGHPAINFRAMKLFTFLLSHAGHVKAAGPLSTSISFDYPKLTLLFVFVSNRFQKFVQTALSSSQFCFQGVTNHSKMRLSSTSTVAVSWPFEYHMEEFSNQQNIFKGGRSRFFSFEHV